MAVAAIVALVGLAPPPVSACSCAGPGDLVEWVNESEAVFVGELVEKRPAVAHPLGGDAIYVFAIETWVKGDLGDVIEVHSAADGAGCGFEFFGEGMRTGAALYLDENGRLSGGLCSQVDPDALLAAINGPRSSETGVPRFLVGGGWASDRMFLLDAGGGLVSELHPPEGSDPFTGTIGLSACPGNRVAVQLTTTSLHVWDATTGQLNATIGLVDAGDAKWVTDVACESPDGSQILAIVRDESSASLIDVVTLEELAILPGEVWKFGPGFVAALEKGERGLARIDLDTGERASIYAIGDDVALASDFAVHRGDGRIALLETRFSDEGPVATLVVLSASGDRTAEFEIEAEAYQPSWLSDNSLAIQTFDSETGEQPAVMVFDLDTGDRVVVDDWQADYLQGDRRELFATRRGDVIRADLATGATEVLTTLPVQSTGPLVLLPLDLDPVTTTTSIGSNASPEATVPPLVSPEMPVGTEAPVEPRIVARVAMVVVAFVLIALALSSRRRRAQ